MPGCNLNTSPQQRFVICQQALWCLVALAWHLTFAWNINTERGSGSLHTWINTAQVPLQHNPPVLFVIKFYYNWNHLIQIYQLKRLLAFSFSLISLYEVWHSTLTVWRQKERNYKLVLSWLDLLWESKSHEYSPDDWGVAAMEQTSFLFKSHYIII